MNNNEHKSSVLMLYTILRDETNEEHPLSTNELIDRINEKYGLLVHRTTVASDVEILRSFGADVVSTRSRRNEYFLARRDFELTELKLLVDAVNSSRLVTEKKCGELVEKLSHLTDVTHADELRRVLYTDKRIKPSNERVYYIMDTLYQALSSGRKVRFQYYEYGPDKKRRARHNGKPYILSPYSLMWHDDFYYVVGYSENRQDIVNFRVDRIGHPVELMDEPIRPMPEGFELESYGIRTFQMYPGEEFTVVLKCENEVMKSVIDRFGEGVDTWILDEEHFGARVDVSVSQTFFAWVFTFGEKMKIIEPAVVRERYLSHLAAVTALYDEPETIEIPPLPSADGKKE